ncbi:MAG: tRNA (5-methylaminomethyl-2-thiouridine)(34)-methyltransferase MnmD [Candidatus Woesearchaeota archaeon]
MAKYEKVKTGDGSETFRNTEIDECYHTKSGSFHEALEKHVRPSRIVEIAKKNSSVVIGDACFGLGYNTLMALHHIRKECPGCNIKIIAFENDPALMEEASRLTFDKTYEQEATIIKSMLKPPYQYFSSDFQGSVWVGDLAKMLMYVPDDTFDVIFYDPFSPKKQPEMWSEELFRQAYRSMRQGGRLTTYSCARIVRDNMKKAGFAVEDGPCIGRRSPSTIAVKK